MSDKFVWEDGDVQVDRQEAERQVGERLLIASFDRRANPPELTRCPQCGSLYCGPYRCRFSGKTHEEYRREKEYDHG